VGKMVNPHYFVENQADGVNLHDALDDPYKSAEIIIGHVPEGIRLAERHKLPRRIIDCIAQHHGTTSVAWFHHKACEDEGEASVNAAGFCYPGPKPQSREAAILMLADTVEATARAVKPTGIDEIDLLIRNTISGKLDDGQLDESDLNLRDIDSIRRAFVEVLQGIYHPRITYPGQRPALAAAATELEATAPDPQGETHERAGKHSGSDRAAVGTTG
ncbi:MAG: HD domain-containing protein, partial [Geodermatophilaceae bacterium]|nr:HD domain-containing protein [Geodermatophilaceae bacterium]